MPARRPVDDNERLAAIDAVRALALFGVVVVNVVTEVRVSLFAWLAGVHTGPGGAVDLAIERAVAVVLESKAFTCFALLFGVGLAVQASRWRKNFPRLVRRRLAVLAVIGALHLVFLWNGDILLHYAAVGLVLSGALAWSGEALLLLGGLLLAIWLFLPLPGGAPSGADLDALVLGADRAYGHGSWSEALAFRVAELRWLWPLHLHTFARTGGVLCLGAWSWHAGVWRRPEEHRVFLRILAGPVLAVGLVDALLSDGAWGSNALHLLAGIGLSFGYVAAFLLAWDSPLRPILAALAPLGRVALSAYLMQSVAFTAVFYGWGLGWFDRVSAGTAVAFASGLWASQAVGAALWLRWFQFGPVEWVWRSATYGTVVTLRRAAAPRRSPPAGSP